MMRALARVIRPASNAARVPGNRVHNDRASATRDAAVPAETANTRPTSATADSWACESPAPADRLRACALAMNDVISRACRAWAQAMTRSQPPTRSNASSSWCFAAVSAGCASMSASRPSGTYCDQRTGSAVPTGRSSTRQSMISFSGGSDYRWRRRTQTASIEHVFDTTPAVRLSKSRHAVGAPQLGLSTHAAVCGLGGSRNRLRCDGAQPDDCGR